MAILILENSYKDLVKSRIPLGSYFESKGAMVFYACPFPEDSRISHISMSRNRLVVTELIQGSNSVNRLEKSLGLESVLSFRLIPNVLNYLASFRNKDVHRIAVITGLGYAFISTNKSYRIKFQRILIKIFYRMASKRIQIIAQNNDDLSDLGVKNGKVILGSGVESILFNGNEVQYKDSINILYVGRLLKSKGISTIISVFERIKTRNNSFELTIAGTIDQDNPDSITEAELSEIKKKSGVNYLGYVDDMDTVYEECSVLFFPSTYREGVPRVLLEALRHGLTIVTRDMPGCKETINGNGYLIHEEEGIEGIIEYFLSLDHEKISDNYKKSRELFESTFSSHVIYPQYLSFLS